MAKFKKFDAKEHIKGLAEAARQLKSELELEETRNFEECMDYFSKLAETPNALPMILAARSEEEKDDSIS